MTTQPTTTTTPAISIDLAIAATTYLAVGAAHRSAPDDRHLGQVRHAARRMSRLVVDDATAYTAALFITEHVAARLRDQFDNCPVHGHTHGHGGDPVALMFAHPDPDGTIRDLDAHDVPAGVRFFGRWFTACINRDHDTTRALFDTLATTDSPFASEGPRQWMGDLIGQVLAQLPHLDLPSEQP